MEPHEMELLGCYSRNPDNKPLKKALTKDVLVSLPKEKTEYPNLKHSYNLRIILLREFSPLRKELGREQQKPRSRQESRFGWLHLFQGEGSQNSGIDETAVYNAVLSLKEKLKENFQCWQLVAVCCRWLMFQRQNHFLLDLGGNMNSNPWCHISHHRW